MPGKDQHPGLLFFWTRSGKYLSSFCFVGKLALEVIKPLINWCKPVVLGCKCIYPWIWSWLRREAYLRWKHIGQEQMWSNRLCIARLQLGLKKGSLSWICTWPQKIWWMVWVVSLCWILKGQWSICSLLREVSVHLTSPWALPDLSFPQCLTASSSQMGTVHPPWHFCCFFNQPHFVTPLLSTLPCEGEDSGTTKHWLFSSPGLLLFSLSLTLYEPKTNSIHQDDGSTIIEDLLADQWACCCINTGGIVTFGEMILEQTLLQALRFLSCLLYKYTISK